MIMGGSGNDSVLASVEVLSLASGDNLTCPSNPSDLPNAVHRIKTPTLSRLPVVCGGEDE